MKAIVKISLVIVMLTSLLTSCDQKKQQLKEQVAKYSEMCPMSFGDLLSLSSVSLDGNTVEMRITVNEAIASISVMNNHKEEVKEITSMSITKETCKVLVDKIIDAGANLKTVIVGQQSNSRGVIEFTADELKRAKERYSNMTEGQKLIASNVLAMKLRLPVMVDEDTKLVGLSLSADALKYKFEVNDSEVGSEIESMTSFMKYITLSQMANEMKTGLIGERNKQFYKALIDCNQGIECEYHELQTGKRLTFRISTDEIKEVLNGKWNNQPTASDWEKFGKLMDSMVDSEIVEPIDITAIFDEYRSIVSNYALKNNTCKYFYYDLIRNDACEELWVQTGDCEADTKLYIYAYDETLGKVKKVFETSAGHSGFCYGEDYILQVCSHQLESTWYKITYNGKEINIREVYSESCNSIEDMKVPSEPDVDMEIVK